MKLLLPLFVLALCLLPQAEATCERKSLEEQIQQAELIFIGKQSAKEFVGYNRAKTMPGSEDSYASEQGETPLWKWKLNRFVVEKSFKGTVSSQITVVSPRFFTVGSRYLVFATRADKKDRFNKTTAGWVNTPCDPADYVSEDMPPALLKNVEQHFDSMRLE